MKLLIQHRHLSNEISGVITYIEEIIPELEKHGIKVNTVSTREHNIKDWWKLILWADIVHMNSNDLVFAILCKLLNKKIIIKYHYSFYQSTHSRYEQMDFRKRLRTELKHTLPKSNYPLKWKLYTAVKWARLATRLVTALIVNRHTACSNFLGESCAFPWEVITLYNPIAINNENPDKNSKTLSTPYKFVFVGRLEHDKGVDILLRSALILQNETKKFEILIIGDGSQIQALKQLVSDLKISNCVRFLGKLSHQEVITQLRDALALVAPSRWQDPAPYVVLEASITQTCSIVSKMGGLPEVAGPHGVLFENEDAEGLASCMRYYLNNPGEAINQGLLSSQYVAETFSSSHAATQLLKICNDLVPKRLAKTVDNSISTH